MVNAHLVRELWVDFVECCRRQWFHTAERRGQFVVAADVVGVVTGIIHLFPLCSELNSQ